jgi:hypothetical protein
MASFINYGSVGLEDVSKIDCNYYIVIKLGVLVGVQVGKNYGNTGNIPFR